MSAARSTFTTRRRTRVRMLASGAVLMLALGGSGVSSSVATIDTGPRAVFVPITPCRIMDTRPGADNVGARTAPLAANDTHTIQTRGTNGNCTIPADAAALTMNVAVIEPTGSSFLTVFPSGVPRPLAANLNWVAGDPPKSNAVTVDIGNDGAISFYNLTGTVHLAADVVGFYVDHNHADLYAPLGHTHDDRYARSEQTLQLDGSALNLGYTGQLVYTNGCLTDANAASGAYGSLPLPLPLGARLVEARVTMLDNNTAVSYYVALVRKSVSETGADFATLESAVGGSLVIRTVEHTLTPGATEIVTADRSYVIVFELGAVSGNAVCQVSVDYDTTP